MEPDTFSPLPKNPLTLSFFVHIGLAEELGSGTRELFKNSRLYTGRDPELEEGLIFRAFVPTVPAAETVHSPLGQHTTRADEPDEAVALALKLAGKQLRACELPTWLIQEFPGERPCVS